METRITQAQRIRSFLVAQGVNPDTIYSNSPRVTWMHGGRTYRISQTGHGGRWLNYSDMPWCVSTEDPYSLIVILHKMSAGLDGSKPPPVGLYIRQVIGVFTGNERVGTPLIVTMGLVLVLWIILPFLRPLLEAAP